MVFMTLRFLLRFCGISMTKHWYISVILVSLHRKLLMICVPCSVCFLYEIQGVRQQLPRFAAPSALHKF